MCPEAECVDNVKQVSLPSEFSLSLANNSLEYLFLGLPSAESKFLPPYARVQMEECAGTSW